MCIDDDSLSFQATLMYHELHRGVDVPTSLFLFLLLAPSLCSLPLFIDPPFLDKIMFHPPTGRQEEEEKEEGLTCSSER